MNAGLFVLDLDRCTGCSACVVACTTENHPAAPWRMIHTFNRQRFPANPVVHYSLSCNHCLRPACLENCPAAAYTRDEATGAILLLEERCMGCRYCSWVCPYDAPRFNARKGVMEKCTWCSHRLEEGLDPACVGACPVDALRYQENGERRPINRPGLPETGLEPSLRVLGRRKKDPPRMTAAPAHPEHPATAEISWEGLRSEWSLWLFTTIAAFLVGWFTARISLGERSPGWFFAAAGLFGMAISALHLGRINRIYRAIFNIRGSWVSREVAFFTLFFALGCGLPFAPGLPPAVRWATAVVGFAALFSMDLVYRVPSQYTAAVPHSAMTTFTAIFCVGLFTTEAALVWPVAGLKLVLYLARRHPVRFRWPLATLRIVGGLVVPAVSVAADGLVPPALALTAFAIGELIDRAGFYAGLEFPTPSRQIELDLRRRPEAA